MHRTVDSQRLVPEAGQTIGISTAISPREAW